MLPIIDLAPIGAAILLAGVHVITPSLRFLGGIPRSIWLSIAGGVSVAYVFLHLLPELAEGQRHVNEVLLANSGTGEVVWFDGIISFTERHVYLITLGGLVLFYGLDKLALRARGQRPPGKGNTEASNEASAGPGVFWVHMISFGFYNLVIGYLLVSGERRTLTTLVFFATAMSLHFVVTDFSLHEHHKAVYRRVGRWLLIAALLAGVGLGYVLSLPLVVIDLFVAFLAGGIILNTLKEEVPSERQSRFWAFGTGIGVYAFLLLTF